MKKLVALLLALSMVFALCGCGINEYQQQFLDAVAAAEEASEDSSLNAIENAFSKYLMLTEKDVQNKKVEEAKNALFELFNDKVSILSEEEMSASLDAKISELEAIVSALPEDLQAGISGCEQLKAIRREHFQWYTNQNSILVDKIEEINSQFEELNLAETVSLIDETLPLVRNLENLSYEKDMDAIKEEYGLTSPAEIIELLENIEELIPQMCYTDCYVVRFEYLFDYPKDYIESGSNFFSYGYTYRNTMLSYYREYRDYLDKHFTRTKAETKNGSTYYTYDVNCEKPLRLETLDITSYELGWYFYAVEVYPPYMLDSEKNWEA